MFLAVLPACPQWPPFYNWLPNDPQFSRFFTPMTLLLLRLVRNGLVFTRVVYWMTPYFGEYTFYLIGPYFWLGVGTYLSLQIGSAPPRGLNSAKSHFDLMSRIGSGRIFKVGGGPNFESKKWRVSAERHACTTQGGGVWGGCAPLRSRSFFENVVLNEAIWCTIFHHFKHFTASLLLRCLLPCLL